MRYHQLTRDLSVTPPSLSISVIMIIFIYTARPYVVIIINCTYIYIVHVQKK